MNSRSTTLLLTVATLVLLQFSARGDNHDEAKHNTLTDAEKKAGWILLFDGKTTDGWRGFKRDKIPAGWKAVDGTLARLEKAGDIVTVDQYDNFELRFDWKIAPNGNSGVFYRATEDKGGPWETGPEYQILDNDSTKYGDAKIETNIAGSNYALYKSDRGAAKKAGEWNTGRIIADGNHIEHWLNGKKVVEYEINSPDWKQRIANSKFKQWPDCGQRKKGHIDLQDHGDNVWYRNIKLRPIKKAAEAGHDELGFPPIVKNKRLYAKNDFRGKAAPEFFVQEWIGDEIEHEGKVVLVDFWATWCGPCRGLIPELNNFHEKYKDNLAVIGVSDEDPAKVRDLMKTTAMHYGVAIDQTAKMKDALDVEGIPHVMIVDSKGIVRWQGFPGSREDPLTAAKIEQIIKADKAQRVN